MARRDRDFDYDDPLIVPGRWKRWLLRGGFLAAAGVALYFIACSDVFLRRIVLPRLVSSLNGEVTVGAISLDPFSRLRLSDLRVNLADGQTVLAAKEAEIRYGLMGLLRGRWIFPEIRLVSPEFNVIRTADGSTSLDRLLASETPRRPLVLQPPTELLVGRLSVENATFSYEHQLPSGEQTRVAGREVRLLLANLGHGREVTMELGGRIGMEKLRDGGGGRLILGLESSSSSSLGKHLRPSAVKTDIRIATQEATGDYASLAGMTGQFDGLMGDKEIQQCRLRFEKAGASLGSLEVQGPVDFEKMDLRLRAGLKGLSHEVLDLVGSPFGMSFGQARIDGDLLVNLANNGDAVIVTSTLAGTGLGVRTPTGTTPALDVTFRLDGRMQRSTKTADIRSLSFTAREGDRELLYLNAPQAINLLWNPAMRSSINDSSVDFRVNALDLARWRPLFGAGLPQGVVTIEGVMTNRDDGRRLRAWVTNRIEGLAFTAGPYAVSNATARVVTRLELRDFFSLAAEETSLEAAIDGVSLVTGRGEASYEFRNQELRMRFDLRGGASNLVARFPHPLIEATAGEVRLDGATQLRRGSRMVGGSLVLDGFQGRLERYAFSGEWLRAECSVDWGPEQLFVRQFGLSVGRAAGRAGSVYANGRVSSAGEVSLDLTAVDLGPGSLAPFLRPHLGAVTLAGGTIDGQGRVQITPAGRRDVDLEITTERLTFRDEAAGVDHFPLTMKTAFSLSQTGQRFELSTNTISLPPTLRATNVLSATGTLDFSPAAGEPGTISIRAPSLDLTEIARFYRTNQPTVIADSTVRSSLPADHAATSAGNRIPVPDFVADLDVRRLFVADLEATNWLARASFTNGLFRLDSLSAEIGAGRLRVRGQAPVREGAGDGLIQVAAEHLPIDPLSTALLGVARGRYAGDVSVELDYAASGDRGLGAAPASGRFSLIMTNLVFRGLPEWTRRTLGPVATAFKMDEILRSSLRYVGGRAQLTGDAVSLRDWTAIGDLFILEMAGEATLGPTWAESSFDLPVSFALRDALAQRLPVRNLRPAVRPDYLLLPSFLTVQGSPSDWSPILKTEDPELLPVLTGSLGRVIGGQPGETMEGGGNLLQGGGARGPAPDPTTPGATSGQADEATKSDAGNEPPRPTGPLSGKESRSGSLRPKPPITTL